MKITPILIVEQIEKSLPFWTGRMGFVETVAVPNGNRLGFVILVRDGAEIMLQTIKTAREDGGAALVLKADFAPSALWIEVNDFEDVLKRLDGYPVALADRTTNYGMREIGVHEPSGHIVMFAAKAN